MSGSREERVYASLPKLGSDLEIAQSIPLRPIGEIASACGLEGNELRRCGPHMAKINHWAFDRVRGNPQGKLILVTAMTATRAGEGKTVTAIGLGQALSHLGHQQITCLREPSLGPTFGFKGGATGGGMSQMLPMDDINLHFTGDIHAIGSAHNLLAAMVDNHIYHGNDLGIDPQQVVWRRVMDLCDRQLRFCETGLGGKFDGMPRLSGFDITAASEVMAVVALAEDRADLEERLGRMVVAYRHSDEPVFAKELGCVPAMVALLKDAINPNIVQTGEHTPVLVHCGPFANIAHGCSSVRASKLALQLADYVVTEAGFAADLGAEKFLHIKCRQSGLQPSVAVLVVSCRALKLHGGVPYEEVEHLNAEALVRGLENVRIHLENLRLLGVPVVVAVNRFPSDGHAELDSVFSWCEEQKVPAALSEVAVFGGRGGEDLAKKVLALADGEKASWNPLYQLEDPAQQKIECLAKQVYRAEGVDFTPEAERSIERLERNGFATLPICVAKTQLSISDRKDQLGAPGPYRLRVVDVGVSNGAGFLVVKTGKILLMPGMGKTPAAQRIGMRPDGQLFGLS